MLKRYKNYIISSDNEEENYDEKYKTSNKLVDKENSDDKKEETKNLNKLKESKILNDNNKFNKSKEKEKEKVNIRKIIYCEICDKRLESSQDYLLHMSSKKHKYKMKELLQKELKEFGSMKKVLINEKMILPHRRWKINNVRYLLYGFALNRYLNK